MSFKDLINKRVEKKVKFMGEDTVITKLTVEEVLTIQDMAKSAEGKDDQQLSVLQLVISSSVSDAKDISEEDFRKFPMDELSKLSNEILKFSGLAGDEKGK